MELNLSSTTKQIILVFLLIILPWIVIGLGIISGVESALYYLLSILWFGMGVIFFSALN